MLNVNIILNLSKSDTSTLNLNIENYLFTVRLELFSLAMVKCIKRKHHLSKFCPFILVNMFGKDTS